MRQIRTRAVLRALHLVSGVAISAYVYSPALKSNAVFEMVLQFGLVPAIGISGLFMWKPRLLRTLLG